MLLAKMKSSRYFSIKHDDDESIALSRRDHLWRNRPVVLREDCIL